MALQAQSPPPSASASNPAASSHARFSLTSAASSVYSQAHSQSQTPTASSSTLPLPRPVSRAPSSAHAPGLHQQLFGSGAGGVSILDRPLNKTKGAEVSLPAFAFLLAEIVSYSQSRVDSVNDLEQRLSSFGYHAGQRILNLILLRNTLAANIKVSSLPSAAYPWQDALYFAVSVTSTCLIPGPTERTPPHPRLAVRPHAGVQVHLW